MRYNGPLAHAPNESKLSTVQVDPDEIREVTIEEVLGVARKISENKAPDLYGIPNKSVLVAVKTIPDRFTEIFTLCTMEVFPRKVEVAGTSAY